ncbi:MAG: hypothetical protein A3E80_02675 [Chlamydiae bacterium RIFCSPHIGHO2_12_FULL_49_9]|nr:MAG: hypothetical protein A3E80_02675 [Chlamydiae bacterium RIFCSPHIGHO2_12_FULL_49_9]
MKLTKNIGSTGRLIRLGVCLLLLGYAYWKGSWIALGAALFVFFEVYFSWCIVYQILGINSCPVDRR